jgi:hypothetical protein
VPRTRGPDLADGDRSLVLGHLVLSVHVIAPCG